MNLMVIIKRLLNFRPYFQSNNKLKYKKGSNYSVFHSQQDFIKPDTKNIVGCGYLTILPCKNARFVRMWSHQKHLMSISNHAEFMHYFSKNL